MQAYTKIDQQLHQLCQAIAKANRTFVPKEEDDSHTNLHYDFLANSITGRWIEGKGHRYLLRFNLSNCHFEWLNESLHLVQKIQVEKRTQVQIEEEIAACLPGLGLDPTGYLDKLHFEIPDYSFRKEPVPDLGEKERNEWQALRKLANEACSWLLGHMQLDGEIRIWPHHFDTGIYFTPNKKLGIGFGLAMEDEIAGEPYFYLSGYALEGSLDYEQLVSLEKGRWEIGEHFKGAIMPVSQLNIDSSHQSTMPLITFIKQALDRILAIHS